LGCYGDGGAVFTDNSEVYEELVSLRVHGQATSGDKYDNVRIGLNARMDTIQAAILLEKLKLYDDELEQRNRVAESYTRHLEGIVTTPVVPENQGCVWAQYSVQSDKRDTIRGALQDKGIPTAVFYPVPVHLSTAYKHLGYRAGDFPVAEAASQRIFSLPMHPYLEENQITAITEVIKQAA
ncbi:MAG: DegT/DnrJ/EryC1/StrS family aminotransferase, partial [Arenicella sp.]|nr:DegT/DnrJ/EryC1/StrS family aminotransferase [Arenicella sp.]